MGALLAFFVFIEVDLVDGDGGDARCESTGVDGRGCALMAFEREGVLVLPGNIEVFCDRFCREPHAKVPIWIGFRDAGIGNDAPPTKRDGGHGLDAAGEDAIGQSGVDFGGCDGDGFQTGGTVAVHGHARHLVGVEPHQTDHATDVQALLGLRGGIADNDIVDAFLVQLRKVGEQLSNHLLTEVIRSDKSKGAFAGFANRRTVASYDVCIHGD